MKWESPSKVKCPKGSMSAGPILSHCCLPLSPMAHSALLLTSCLGSARACHWTGALPGIQSLDFLQHFLLILSLPFTINGIRNFPETGFRGAGWQQVWAWPGLSKQVLAVRLQVIQITGSRKAEKTQTLFKLMPVSKGIKFSRTSWVPHLILKSPVRFTN